VSGETALRDVVEQLLGAAQTTTSPTPSSSSTTLARRQPGDAYPPSARRPSRCDGHRHRVARRTAPSLCHTVVDVGADMVVTCHRSRAASVVARRSRRGHR
jgi:hypothetical protein